MGAVSSHDLPQGRLGAGVRDIGMLGVHDARCARSKKRSSCLVTDCNAVDLSVEVQ